MTEPINNDPADPHGGAVEGDTAAEENIAGTTVTTAVGRKKSYMDKPIPSNTAANPDIGDFSGGPVNDPSFPQTPLSAPTAKPKYKASNFSDGIRMFMKKYWVADSSRLGVTFGNKDTHKQGENYPIVVAGAGTVPFTLHMATEDVEHAYSNVGSLGTIYDEEGSSTPALICSDKIEDPRLHPDHAEHKDFLVYGLGMSSHTQLTGKEKLERIIFTKTEEFPGTDSNIKSLKDWKYFCGMQMKSLDRNYEGVRLHLPVYETVMSPAVLESLQASEGFDPSGQTETVLAPTGEETGQVISNYGATAVSFGGDFVYDSDDANKNIFANQIYIQNAGSSKRKRHTYEIERILNTDSKYATGKMPDFHKLQTYHDHCFSYSTPTSHKLTKDLNTQVKSMIYKVEPEYNMFMQNYEVATKWDDVPESLLPSLYMFLSQLKNEDPDNLEFLRHITLDSHLFPEKMDQWLGEHGGFLKPTAQGSSLAPKTYFTGYANMIREFINSTAAQELVDKYSRTGFTFGSMMDIMNDARMRSFIFPMNISLSFNTDNKTKVAEMMNEASLTCMFFKLLSYTGTEYMENRPFGAFFEEAKQFTDVSTNETKVESITLPSAQGTYKTWSLQQILDVIDNAGPELYGAAAGIKDYATMLGYGDKVDISAPEHYFYRYLMSTLFNAKVKKIIKNNTRTYLDILKGKQAYNETLFYKIEKRRKPNQDNYDELYNGENSGTPPDEGVLVQTMFLPNSNELDVFEYIDTQVKYGYKYTYQVMAYQLVCGTEYQLCRSFIHSKAAPLNKDEIASGKATPTAMTTITHALSQPSPIIVEVPYFGNLNSDKVTACVIDDPPPPPDFDIEPYKGYANKILINLSSNTGEIELEPQIIEEEDFKKFSDVYISQDINPPKGPVRFSSDEAPVVYEIFRCTKPPKSYGDFKGKKVKTLQFEPPDYYNTCVDDIKPNKKYYYTFRVIDGHSWVSNPTPIMQIELIENDGATYLLQEEYHFPLPEDNFVPTKNLKKYLYIEPNQAQITVDYSNMVLDLSDSAYDMPEGEKPTIGIKNEKLIGKKFKIRIKSKNTGKVFDLNFQFAHDHLPVDKSTLSYYMNTLSDGGAEE